MDRFERFPVIQSALSITTHIKTQDIHDSFRYLIITAALICSHDSSFMLFRKF